MFLRCEGNKEKFSRGLRQSTFVPALGRATTVVVQELALIVWRRRWLQVKLHLKLLGEVSVCTLLRLPVPHGNTHLLLM
jgi:hypothetical protein